MPRRPTLRQLEYLVAVADCGHFGNAARQVNATQPTLSVQLQALEDCLGEPLIDRSRRTITATPAGEEAIRRAREILSEVDQLIAAVAQSKERLGGLIRLGSAPSIGPYLLPSVIPQLHRDIPALELYVREEIPSRIEPLVIDGSLDIALSVVPVDSEKLEHFILGEEALLIGMPIDHKLASHDAVPPEALSGQRFLTLGSGHRLYDDVRRLCTMHGAEFQSDYEGTSLDALRQMVGLGMGLSIFPEHYSRSEIERDPSVVVRPFAPPGMSRTIGFFWRRNSVRVKALQNLANRVRLALTAHKDMQEPS